MDEFKIGEDDHFYLNGKRMNMVVTDEDGNHKIIETDSEYKEFEGEC